MTWRLFAPMQGNKTRLVLLCFVLQNIRGCLLQKPGQMWRTTVANFLRFFRGQKRVDKKNPETIENHPLFRGQGGVRFHVRWSSFECSKIRTLHKLTTSIHETSFLVLVHNLSASNCSRVSFSHVQFDFPWRKKNYQKPQTVLQSASQFLDDRI